MLFKGSRMWVKLGSKGSSEEKKENTFYFISKIQGKRQRKKAEEGKDARKETRK